MKLTYNDVTMEMAEIQSYTRENVYSQDGVDLLYVKHRLTVMLTVAPGGRPAAISRAAPQVKGDYTYQDTKATNPQRDSLRVPSVLSETLPSDAPITNEAQVIAGIADQRFQPSGFMTDHELRLRLMIPRKRLFIKAYDAASGEDRVWIKAPRSDPRSVLAPPSELSSENGTANRIEMPHSDAANGPTPLRCDIVGAVGDAMSMGFLYTIEFNLVPVNSDIEKLILSHRWEISHQSDEDYYLTRVTTGIIVANGELLRGFNYPLSVFQQELFHPIPLGFVRSAPEVKISPDGLTLMYTLKDRDPECMFDPGDSGATHMDIQETVNLLNPDPLAAILASARGGLFGLGSAAVGSALGSGSAVARFGSGLFKTITGRP